jgi:hypothetical protein
MVWIPRRRSLQIQFRSVKGAPLALGDENIAGLCQTIDQLAEIFGKAARRHRKRLIDRLAQGILEIPGESYVHKHDGRANFTKAIGKFAADLGDLSCGMGTSSCPMMPFCRSIRTSAVVRDPV